MSLKTPIYHIETENKVLVNLFDGDFWKKVGKIGMAGSTTLGAAYGVPAAYVALASDAANISPYFKMSTGLSSSRSAQAIGDEKEINQFSLTGINLTGYEYDKSSSVGAVLINGSSLEAVPVKNIPYDYSKVEEVTETGIRATPYSVFDIEDEEIAFDQQLTIDYSNLSINESADVYGIKPIDKFDL